MLIINKQAGPVLMALLFLCMPIVLSAEEPAGHPKEGAPTTDSKIYKYTGKDGIPVFTNNMQSVPESLREKVQVLEVKPEAKPEEKPEVKITQPTSFTLADAIAGLKNPFIRNILIAIGLIVLFWIMKLWIKNIILKFIAKIAIKVAIVGLLYMLAHQWYFSSDKTSFFKTVQKQMAPYKDILPIQKATEGIKAFNEKQKEEKKELDAIQ